LLLSLTVTEKELLIKVEQKYLDMVPSNLRYNFCPTAGSSLGYTHTPEALAAIRGRTRKTHSEETKAAIGAAISKAVYVYDRDNVLVDSFHSHTAAAAFLGVSQQAVSKLVDTGRRNRRGYLYTSTPLT
jgi:hypothetical protein